MVFFWAYFFMFSPYYLFYHWEKKKLLSPKLDTLQEHFGWHKSIFAAIDYNKDATHNKNERIYIGRGQFAFNIVQFGNHASSKKKLVQFASIFHSLNHGQPMTKFENLRDLYVLWNVKNNKKKHWINSTEWGMVKCMHEIVLKKTISICKNLFSLLWVQMKWWPSIINNGSMCMFMWWRISFTYQSYVPLSMSR